MERSSPIGSTVAVVLALICCSFTCSATIQGTCVMHVYLIPAFFFGEGGFQTDACSHFIKTSKYARYILSHRKNMATTGKNRTRTLCSYPIIGPPSKPVVSSQSYRLPAGAPNIQNLLGSRSVE